MEKNLGTRLLCKNLDGKAIYGSQWHVTLPQEAHGKTFDVFYNAKSKHYTMVPVPRTCAVRTTAFGLYIGQQRIGGYPETRSVLSVPYDETVKAYERFYYPETGIYTLVPLTAPSITEFGKFTGTRVLQVSNFGRSDESVCLSIFGCHTGSIFLFQIEDDGVIHLVPSGTKYSRGKLACLSTARRAGSQATIGVPRKCREYLTSLGVKIAVSKLFYARYYDEDSGVYTFVPLRKFVVSEQTKLQDEPIEEHTKVVAPTKVVKPVEVKLEVKKPAEVKKPEMKAKDTKTGSATIYPPHVYPPTKPSEPCVKAPEVEFVGCFKTHEKSANNFLCSIDLPYAFIGRWYDIHVDAYTGVITLSPKKNAGD